MQLNEIRDDVLSSQPISELDSMIFFARMKGSQPKIGAIYRKEVLDC